MFQDLCSPILSQLLEEGFNVSQEMVIGICVSIVSEKERFLRVFVGE